MVNRAALFVGLAAAAASSVRAQSGNESLPNSFPHDYPGKPSGDFSPAWQSYFEVKDPLPNVTFPLTRSFAGNVPVNRAGHPNDTLFFWAFESTNGSLTASNASNSDKPWAVWLNGGPGASSLLGLLLENGPLHVTESGDMSPNNFSWNQFADYIWVDQPVGVGFSTADSDGYVVDEDQMGQDFVGFLSNIVKVFPSLAERPFFLTGESYAGTYIPYIMKAIFSTPNPPVRVVKAAIGNGAIGTIDESEEMPALQIIATYPQLIGYDPAVYEYFQTQAHLCGWDLNLTYPQVGGHFPSININESTGLPETNNGTVALASPASKSRSVGKLSKLVKAAKAMEKRSDSVALGRRGPQYARFEREREERRRAWIAERVPSAGHLFHPRDLSGRPNGTIDPFYGCFLGDEIEDYALNFSLPWSAAAPETVDDVTNAFAPLNPYDIPDARKPPPELDPTTFLNDFITRTALHAPTSKNWSLLTNYPFNNTFDFPPTTNPFGDPSEAPSGFFDEFAANMSTAGIPLVIYSGNDDSVVNHFASEVVIQNTTFGGIQGFTKKPQTPFTDDEGNFMGIVHQERNWTYVLVDNAGHEVPEFNPPAALIMFREFIIGSNQTGLVQPDGTVVGGEDPSLRVGDILPGTPGILAGSGTATSLFFGPTASAEAWNVFYSSVVSAQSDFDAAQTASATGTAIPSTAFFTPTATVTATPVPSAV